MLFCNTEVNFFCCSTLVCFMPVVKTSLMFLRPTCEVKWDYHDQCFLMRVERPFWYLIFWICILRDRFILSNTLKTCFTKVSVYLDEIVAVCWNVFAVTNQAQTLRNTGHDTSFIDGIQLSKPGVGNLLVNVCRVKIPNHSVCHLHPYFCASQGQ